MLGSDFISFFNRIIQTLKNQIWVILIFVVLGGAIGTIKVLSSEERYREEILVSVDKPLKREVIARINFLDADGSGEGQMADDFKDSEDILGSISSLKAENLADTSLNQFNVRYFVEDTSLIEDIDEVLIAYLHTLSPSINIIDTQLFVVPSSGIRSILSLVFTFLIMGIVIGIFREVRTQKS